VGKYVTVGIDVATLREHHRVSFTVMVLPSPVAQVRARPLCPGSVALRLAIFGVVECQKRAIVCKIAKPYSSPPPKSPARDSPVQR